MRRSMLVSMSAGFLTLLVVAGSADAQRLFRGGRLGRSGPAYYPTEEVTNSPDYSTMSSPMTASTGDPQSGVRQSFYRTPELNPKMAELRVIVPTQDARVWIEKGPTEQKGIERVFVSPVLEPGVNYSYTVRATWMENGREIATEKQVPVKPGFAAVVYFGTQQQQQQQPVEDLPRPRRFFR